MTEKTLRTPLGRVTTGSWPGFTGRYLTLTDRQCTDLTQRLARFGVVLAESNEHGINLYVRAGTTLRSAQTVLRQAQKFLPSIADVTVQVIDAHLAPGTEFARWGDSAAPEYRHGKAIYNRRLSGALRRAGFPGVEAKVDQLPLADGTWTSAVCVTVPPLFPRSRAQSLVDAVLADATLPSELSGHRLSSVLVVPAGKYLESPRRERIGDEQATLPRAPNDGYERD